MVPRPDIEIGEVLMISHSKDLFDLFPDHDFDENNREDEQNDSIQSSY